MKSMGVKRDGHQVILYVSEQGQEDVEISMPQWLARSTAHELIRYSKEIAMEIIAIEQARRRKEVTDNVNWA